jgi:hypothetical protein
MKRSVQCCISTSRSCETLWMYSSSAICEFTMRLVVVRIHSLYKVRCSTLSRSLCIWCTQCCYGNVTERFWSRQGPNESFSPGCFLDYCNHEVDFTILNSTRYCVKVDIEFNFQSVGIQILFNYELLACAYIGCLANVWCLRETLLYRLMAANNRPVIDAKIVMCSYLT